MVKSTHVRYGWGMIEVVVAVLVAAVLSIPILVTFTAARSETGKAINYLRAMELAQEALVWVRANPMTAKARQKLSDSGGALNTVQGGRLVPTPYRTGADPRLPATTVVPPADYGDASYFREITVNPVAPGRPGADYLYRATVTVYWHDEAQVADPRTLTGTKKVVLSALVCDERRGY